MNEIKWEVTNGSVDCSDGLEFRSYLYEVAILKSAENIKNAKIEFYMSLNSYSSERNMIFTVNLENHRENEYLSILFHSDGNIEIWEVCKGFNKKLASLKKYEDENELLKRAKKGNNSVKSKIKINICGSLITISRNDIEILNANKTTNYSAQVNINFEGQGLSVIKNFTITNMKLKAFVIMDFSEEFESIYTKVIKPICEKEQILCVRADEFRHPGKITSDVIKAIIEADIIIAEVTPSNENVYFEFGYAYAFNKLIVPLVDKNKRKKLPFDTFDIRTIFYENSEQGIKNVEKDLSAFLKTIKDKTFGGSVYRDILLNERERI